MKKTFVLVVLFVLPIVVYLFFASGVINFGRLPVLNEKVGALEQVNPNFTLDDKITILGFLGNQPQLHQGNAFNLNQKIYKPFYEFEDFQVVMLAPADTEDQVRSITEELGNITDMSRWSFVHGSSESILAFFKSMGTPLTLEDDLSTPYVFIIDKQGRLRGRNKDEDEGTKYGFDATSVADLNNKMKDDVKIILAEYRFARKSNQADR